MESSVRKKLLILYTKNPDEVYNRKSAIGSYVHSLAILLSDKFEVTLNGQGIDYAPAGSLADANNSKIKTIIKGLLPAKLKAFLRDRKHLRSLPELTEKIASLGINFDTILEFYNFGSMVGHDLAERTGADLHLIYDGPIFEEYVFFNGHKSFFEGKCREFEKKSFQRAISIVVYSNAMRQFCIDNIHHQTSKYRIHQNVDFSRFHLFEGEKDFSKTLNICFVGSFLKWHRVDFLLRAFKKMLDMRPALPVKLYLIGDGMERHALQLYAGKLGLGQNVIFTGFIDGKELKDLQSCMHIGVMPSAIWYQAPNKIFEYGAMKMACVAPSTPTISDIFSPDEILFFENNNEESLFTTLVEICNNREKLQRFAQNLNNRISGNFNASKTHSFYEEILDVKNATCQNPA